MFALALAGCAAPSTAPAPQPTAPPAAPTTAPALQPKPTTAAAAPAAAPTAAAAAKPAPAAAGGEQAALDDYFQKAKASGQMKVTHYGLGQEYRSLATAFQQKYAGMQVEPVTLRGPEMIQRINAEAASGQYVANVASTG